MFEDFHFIRPLWFYAFIPAIALFVWLFFKKHKSANWSKICDPELLDYFLVQNGKTASRYPIIILLVSWLISVFALAGPSWEKVKSPIYTNQDALVIILDLSLSMNASDIKPSRLERAKHKLDDILQNRQEGQTALMVYAGDAHIVSPLTPDNKTILSFIPVLDSSLMPVAGSNLNAALLSAEKLFKNSGIAHGKILLLSDGIEANKEIKVLETIQNLQQSGYLLSVMGVGTVDGAPIPDKQNKGFIKDKKGNIVLSKLDESTLKKLAVTGHGRYQRMTLSNKDIDNLLINTENDFKQQDKDSSDSKISQQQWHDQGSLFVLLLLPLALLLFRKGWIIGLLIILTPIPYQPAYSMSWDDLWLRSDQQGLSAFSLNEHSKAAEKFNNIEWKASSYYKAGKYEQAIETFSQSDSIDAKYNTANSYTQLKQFDKALQNYNEVLKINPNHKDSLKNKSIVKNLIKKQEEFCKNPANADNPKCKKKTNPKKQKDCNDPNDPECKMKENKKQNSDKNSEDKSDKKSDKSKSSNKNDKAKDNQSKQEQDEQTAQEQKDKHEQQKKDEKEALNKQQQQEENPDKAQAEEEEEEEDKKQQAQSLFSKLSEEEQQSMEQYLNQIKDDPAYLLRRKFYLNSTRSKQQVPNTQVQQQW